MTDKDLTPETDEPAAQADDLPAEAPPAADVSAPVESAPVADVTPVADAMEELQSGYAHAQQKDADEVEEFESAPVYSYAQPEQTSGDDWMLGDIDAALAAVETLSEIMPEREAEAEARADARQSAPTFVPAMKIPPLTTLRRGQLGSIVPALLLIGLGAWLTLMTTGGTPPDPQLVGVVVVGGIVVSLLAQWLGTGRWSRGALFFALLALLFAGVIVFSVQPTGIDLERGYPLLIVALGLAMALSGLLARPLNVRMLAPSALIVLAGMVALTVTLDLIPADLVASAAPFAPVVLGVALVLWLLPLVFRRR